MTSSTPEELRFREERRKAVRGTPGLAGLDQVQARVPADDKSEWTLRLRFVSEPPEGLSPASFRIVDPTGEVDPGFVIRRVMLSARQAADVVVAVTDPVRAQSLSRDSAEYRLVINSTPGFDRFFSAASFRFDGGQPMDSPSPAEQKVPPLADIDYLAKDYSSFRSLMLERMAALAPDWKERNPADIGVAIVEVLAYAADYLSYYQDAVATEAYLDTARKRSSVRRHLRLLGHTLHEGCNARVWVHAKVDGFAPVDLPAGSLLLTECEDLPVVLLRGTPEYAAALDQGSEPFETMHELRLWPRLNHMPIHTWGVSDFVLPRGATTATLVGHFEELQKGDVLCLEQVARANVEHDPRIRHVLRLCAKPSLTTDPVESQPITELEFFAGDALPFAIPVGGWKDGAGAPLVARGNMVLADHGRKVEEVLSTIRAGESFRPLLSARSLTRREPWDPATARKRAAVDISQRTEQALPALELMELDRGNRIEEVSEPWRPRHDLLESGPFSKDLVPETESDGAIRLRFGDGRQGRKPVPGTRFVASYRIGTGPSGHIGRDSLAHVVSPTDGPLAIASIRNPMPAQGGEAPESLEQARLVAPRSFRKTESCVTSADLERLAESHPEVLRAAASSRWTGSWETLFLFVQRYGDRAFDQDFEASLRRLVEPRLLAGADLALRPPNPLPLEIRLRGVCEEHLAPNNVRTALMAELGSGVLDDGGRGYFHPDNFGFGEPVFLDGLLDAATRVDGVVSIRAEWFRVWGSEDTEDTTDQVPSSIEPGRFEVVSVKNQATAPQLGILDVVVEGV